MKQSISQKINKEAFEKLISESFNNKPNALAEAIGMSRVQMWRILNSKAEPGGDFMHRFMQYCTDNKLEYSTFFNPVEVKK